MNFPFLQTETFYPGFQKLRLFDDGVFRRAVLAVAALAVGTIPVYLLLPEKYNEIIMVVRDILILIPVVYWLCGGVSRRAWGLYSLFGMLFLAGFVPLRLGASPLFWFFLAASALVLLPLMREIPHVMNQLGYREKPYLVKEALTVLVNSATLITIAYLAVVTLMPKWMPDASFKNLGVRTYALMACLSLLHYGAIYGIMYGILFRRLLTMRFALNIPILVNCVLLFITWTPDIFDNSNPMLAFVALFFTGSGIQFILGMGFYYCRSTRAILIAHVLYFMYYKSIFLSF